MNTALGRLAGMHTCADLHAALSRAPARDRGPNPDKKSPHLTSFTRAAAIPLANTLLEWAETAPDATFRQSCSFHAWQDGGRLLHLATLGQGDTGLHLAALSLFWSHELARAALMLAPRDPAAAFSTLHALDARRLRAARALHVRLPSDTPAPPPELLTDLDQLTTRLLHHPEADEAPLRAWRDHQQGLAAGIGGSAGLFDAPDLALVQQRLPPSPTPPLLIAWHVDGDDLLIEHITAPTSRRDPGYRLLRRTGVVPELAAATGRVREAMQLMALAPTAPNRELAADLPLLDDLRRLHDVLFCAAGPIPADTPLLLAPDGFLYGVPFAALRTDGSQSCAEGVWFGDHHPIAVLPTAVWPAEALRASTTASGEALVLGVIGEGRRKLPGGERELKQLSALLSDKGLDLQIGCDRADLDLCQPGLPPTLSTLARHAPQAEIIHIVAHGVSQAHPWLTERGAGTLSHVELVDEQGLPTRLWEHHILATPLRAELVVLSACDTATFEEIGTTNLLSQDHALGLARTFLGAGARTVLASQWPVDDRATLGLMREIYEQYNDEVTTPITQRDPWGRARALADAQRRIRETEIDGEHPFDHPFYWAAFALVGMPGW